MGSNLFSPFKEIPSLSHSHSVIRHQRLRTALSMSFFLLILGSMTAFEVVDCHPQTGKSVNTTFCASIIGGAGDNQITVDKDQTISGPFFGDGVIGNGGNDVNINNGTTVAGGSGTGRNGDIEGDVATGNGGDDVIVNNGIVASDMDGDTALGNGGNDVLINNGSTGDDMDGDNAGKNGGDDLIINNGVVGGDIQADDNEDVDGSHGGNDIIVINGTVEGYVDGDAGVKTGGDDLVILQNGANGGSDHDLYITGNDGNDTLVFNFTVPDKATFDDLSKRIADANPSHGSLTYNGQSFEWENFEHLENQVLVAGNIVANAFIHTEKVFAATFGTDKGTATIYCTWGSITVMGTDRQVKSEYLFTVTADQVTHAIRQAKANKSEVQVAVADGQSLWVQPSGEFTMNDSYARYLFTFWGHVCGG